MPAAHKTATDPQHREHLLLTYAKEIGYMDRRLRHAGRLDVFEERGSLPPPSVGIPLHILKNPYRFLEHRNHLAELVNMLRGSVVVPLAMPEDYIQI